ncbi:MAG: type II toxin-antitoxin system death-on-curing family toxin [Anaerolineales bacterium]|nr:type II toxin-antitoxin system death-on-curing family toxin [Anaerolineales bacterium]MCA9928621.1 type II toxin-antitoxin system death-on-curing family toxin [Anaerolineales bacterium]
MGEVSQGLNFPSQENIIKLNQEHIRRTGGNLDGAGKFHNEGSLNWVLEAIQYPIFGQDLYPTISEKAAILAWTIINGHVFLDGNKRTGISAMEIFLRLNGFFLSARDSEFIEVAILAANAHENEYTNKDFHQWVRNHLRLLF